MKTTIDYNGQEYILSPEIGDRQSAGSIKDLADDFAFDVVTDLNLRYGTDEFNNAILIVRKAVYGLIRDSIINALIPPPKRNLPLLLPPQNKGTVAWLN